MKAKIAVIDGMEQSNATYLVLTNTPTGPDHLPQWHDRFEPLLRSIESAENSKAIKLVWESDRYLVFERL